MNSLIFDIVSLIDYNNDIFKKLNLNNKYIFDITKLEYLKQIRHQSINSLDNLSYNRLSDEKIAILEFDENLSINNLSNASYNNLSNLSSDDSYNNLIENWSYNSLISLESEFSLSNSNNSNNNTSINLDNISINLDNISINKSNINQEINSILKNDYLNFLNYYKEVNDIKYKNLKLYKQLTQKLIYINLEKMKDSFIKLM